MARNGNKNDGKRDKPAARADPGLVHFRASRSLAIFIFLLGPIVLLGVVGAGLWLGHRTRDGRVKTEAEIAKRPGNDTATGSIHHAQPGPWGDLEWQQTVVEVPNECLTESRSAPEPPRWLFKGYSAAQLVTFLESAGLASKERTELLDINRWQTLSDGIALRPSVAAVLSLSPTTRKQIYERLALFAENGAQRHAFHWPVDKEDMMFSGAGLSADTLTLVRRLSYRHGKLVMFADLAVVAATLPKPAEWLSLQKAISRQPAALARLNITPQTDLDALMRYWGIGGYDKDFRPGLEAAARIPEGRKVSILAVLPPFARERLFTFPCAPASNHFDSHWTSFNFFKDKPDPPVTDSSQWTARLKTDYYPVFADPRYGDIIVIAGAGGAVIHSCVFLGDSLVFTKNGSEATMPWVVATLPDVLDYCSAYLPENEAPQLSYYRNKTS